MINGKISIIMPAYNSESFIEESIKSVISQSYQNWELIVVNDGSTDKTGQILKNISKKDNRIKIITLVNNKGIANARNIGILNSNSEYISFLDSDDLLHPEKLEIQVDFMKNKESQFSFTDYYFVDEETKINGAMVNNKLQQISYQELLKTNRIGCLTVMISSKVLKKYKFKKIKHEDFDLWLTILRNEVEFAERVPLKLSYYRKSKDSVSSNKVKSIFWVWNVYKKGQEYSNLETFFLFSSFLINRPFK